VTDCLLTGTVNYLGTYPTTYVNSALHPSRIDKVSTVPVLPWLRLGGHFHSYWVADNTAPSHMAEMEFHEKLYL